MSEAADKSRESTTRRRKRDRLKNFAKKIVGVRSTQSSSDEGSASSSGSNEKTAIADTPPAQRNVDPSQLQIAPMPLQLENNKKSSESILEQSKKSTEWKNECRPPICLIPVKQHADLGLSLAGCGFLSTYHFGVVKCFIRNGKTLMSRMRRVSGASAGSLVSAMLVLAPQELDRSMAAMYEVADELNALPFGALSPGFYLGERLVQIVDKFLPQDISAANHRLFISITQHKTRENRLVSVFADRAYLIKCLSASCYISMYSMGVAAKPPEVDGEPYCDGGYTNNQPDYSDMRTITVSPFCSKNDISPPDDRGFDWNMRIANQHFKVNLRNILRGAQSIFPPSRTTLKQYYDQGYRDAFKFLLENDMLERDGGSEV